MTSAQHMDKLKGVCLGAGYFSHFQYEAWTRIPEVHIAANSNRTLAKAKTIASEFNIPKSYPWDELEEMLEREQPDFIDIITPPETHTELVKIAARRGIHVICQKPLSPSIAESEMIVNTAKEAGIRFLVHENWRWQPWYREIKRQMEAGSIGDLYTISVRMRMGDGWPDDAYLARQPFFRNYPRLLIYETGVHFLDTFRFLGGEINSVYANLQKRNPVIKGEDAGQVFCAFESGASALLDASRYNEADCEDPRHTFGTVRIDGSKGHIELDTDGSLTLKQLGEPAQKINYIHERKGFAGDCVYNLQRHFTDCMLTSQPFESTGDDYLKSIALVEACYESNTCGQAVKIS